MTQKPFPKLFSRRQFLKGFFTTVSLAIAGCSCDQPQPTPTATLIPTSTSTPTAAPTLTPEPTHPPDSTLDPTAIYLNPAFSIDERVDDLVSRMTIKEKVSQMGNEAAAIKRLGIPEYDWWNEALHGVARAGIATVFPQAIGLASTWNPDLIYQMAEVISDEGRAKHHESVRNGESDLRTGLTFWSPNINIFRDPRWGRGQ
ncbi:MAG: glycoside hydrolase family 3 N-terminal domain-containing protein, partial [Anaerolineae bacterium]